jgi:hypothetical protein
VGLNNADVVSGADVWSGVVLEDSMLEGKNSLTGFKDELVDE